MQQPFGIRFGKPTSTTMAVVVCSLSAGSVTVSVVGVGDFVIDTVEIGTDNTPTQDRAGYVGSGTITGLSEYSKYDYVATDGTSSIRGSFWTAPSEVDDFILVPVTCDNSGSLGGLAGAGYTAIRAIAEANPAKGVYIAHIDDHMGYIDRTTIDDSAGTGHVATGSPRITGKEYDYALVAFASFGLFQSLTGHADWAEDEDRLWCLRNIPVLAQWGDHDAGYNNMGWEVDPDDVTGSPSPNTKFTNAQAVYDAFILPFHGAAIDGANSKAWAHQLGCLKLIAPDGITQASGDGGGTTKPTTIYGATQVDNLLAAADDSSVPFKIFLMANGIRHLVDPPTTSSSGTQQPLGGNEGFSTPIAAHADYQRLMTNAGGLMSLNACNGLFGTLLTVHGDYHTGKVMRNRNDAGVNQEWFYSIHLGTINGSTNALSTTYNQGDNVDGSTVEMLDQTVNGEDNWWVVPMYVYGSRALREIEVDFMDRTGASLWNKKFIEGRGGNDAHDISTDLNIEQYAGNGLTGFQ